MGSVTTSTERPEALQVLLDASALLLKAASEEELLAQVLDLASRLLAADAYAVWRAFDEGHTWRIVAKRGLSDRFPMEATAGRRAVPDTVWRIEEIGSDPRIRIGLEAYVSEGLHSLLAVPWTLGTSINGTITFYWRTSRQFTQDDVDYASALSNLSASALNRLELHEQNLREKARLSFLAEASEVLASSLDYEATLDRVARLAVPQIADWCTVHVVEDGVPNRIVVAHADPEMVRFVEEYTRRYPEEIRRDAGLGKVLHTGEAHVVRLITDEMLTLAARDEEHLAMLRKLGLGSSILMPLKAHGKVLGAIRLLAAGTGRHFTDDDIHLAEDLARRAAVAIENAQLHRAVLEQESDLRLSHAAAHMGSWSWDIRTDRIFWSDEFKALHGLPLDVEASQEGGRGLVHPDDRERVLSALAETLASSTDSLNYDYRSVAADGRVLYLQSRGRIQRDAEGKPLRISGLTIDITESRLAEDALRRTEKLAAAGRLAATVAHEVNNPLEALVNLVYLAQRTEGIPKEAAAHLQVADGELARMAHIVRQTLGFYRESTFPQRTEPNLLVSEVLDLYRSRAVTRGIRLEQKSHLEDDAAMLVNAGEIKQVVANLVANSIDATPREGFVRVDVAKKERWVEILVVDSGTGISDGTRKHLFEPFFTTKSDVGTGLGLWVSKGIVEKHGGTITAEPARADATGTTMRVLLPLS